MFTIYILLIYIIYRILYACYKIPVIYYRLILLYALDPYVYTILVLHVYIYVHIHTYYIICIYTEEAAKLTNKKDGVDGEENGDKNKDNIKDNKKEDNFKFRKETVEDEEVKIHPDTCKY